MADADPSPSSEDIVEQLTRHVARLERKLARVEKSRRQHEVMWDRASNMFQRLNGRLELKQTLLAQSLERQQELERARDDMVRMVIHDLKSPLNGMLGFSELLLSGAFGEVNPDQRECLEDLRTAGTDMSDLISTILDLSRLEDGRMPLLRQEVRVDELLTTARQRLAGMAIEHVVTLAIDARVTTVEVDPTVMVRVVTNLLSNAVRYSDGGTLIQLRAIPSPEDEHPGHVRISVIDEGRGLTEAEIAHIFETYSQAAGGAEHRSSTGLGLAFCKLAIEAHDGHIRVSSAPGRGSTFHIDLPQTVRLAAPAELEPPMVVRTGGDASASGPQWSSEVALADAGSVASPPQDVR